MQKMVKKMVIEAESEFDAKYEIQKRFRDGPFADRPCKKCKHAHFTKGSICNNCDAWSCEFVPKMGWDAWLRSANIEIKVVKRPEPEKSEEEIKLIVDLIEHYRKKGYLTNEQALELREWEKCRFNPFDQIIGIKYLVEGLKRVGHYPHAISHWLVNKQKLEAAWRELYGVQ